jgi:hypothetical protein
MDGRRGAVLLTGNEKTSHVKNCYDRYPNATDADRPAIRECIKTDCSIRGGRKHKSRRNSRKNKRSKIRMQRVRRKTAKSDKPN